jgi:hypothetical protein
VENFFDSNFAKYLRRDLDFFLWVIKLAQAPFPLKIVLRPIDQNADIKSIFTREYQLSLMDNLKDYEADGFYNDLSFKNRKLDIFF